MGPALVVSILVMGVTTTIQTLTAILIIRVVRAMLRAGWLAGSFLGPFVALQLTMALLTAGLLLQVAVWAGIFLLLGEFSSFDDAFYHSAVNYTTLGYGDVVMSRRWRLLGPIESANGILMGGVAAGLMFAVLARVKEVRDQVRQERTPC